jgi:hypothetical protein
LLKQGANIRNFSPKVPWKGTAEALVEALEEYANILNGTGLQANKKGLEKMFTGQRIGTPGREKAVNEVLNIVVTFVRENKNSIGRVFLNRIYDAVKAMVGRLSESKSLKNKAKKYVKEKVAKFVEVVTGETKETTGETKNYSYLIECVNTKFQVLQKAVPDFKRLRKKVTHCDNIFHTVEFLVAFIEHYTDIIVTMSTTEDPTERKALNIKKNAAQKFLSTKDTKSTLDALTDAVLIYKKSNRNEIEKYVQNLSRNLLALRNNVAAR